MGGRKMRKYGGQGEEECKRNAAEVRERRSKQRG
jgi:hypothetical protein